MNFFKELRRNTSPALRIAIVSMILCGLLFPIIVTGFAQVIFPNQANGSLAHLSASGNKNRGSYIIAQNFSLPIFFHYRNVTLSASGVDPDITRDDARSQAVTIHNATNISLTNLYTLIDQNLEGTVWVFGYPYVNVLKLNVALVQQYPSVYCPTSANPVPPYCS